jgi:hypothetical protein
VRIEQTLNRLVACVSFSLDIIFLNITGRSICASPGIWLLSLSILQYIVSCVRVTFDGIWIGFIDYLWIVTTRNRNSPKELHTPNITVTTAHVKSSLHSLTFNWALNLLLQTVPVITSWHGPHKKHHSSVAVPLLLIKNLLPSNRHCSTICFTAIA